MRNLPGWRADGGPRRAGLWPWLWDKCPACPVPHREVWKIGRFHEFIYPLKCKYQPFRPKLLGIFAPLQCRTIRPITALSMLIVVFNLISHCLPLFLAKTDLMLYSCTT